MDVNFVKMHFNKVEFILSVPVLFKFYIQGVLKVKKNNSVTKKLITCKFGCKFRKNAL